MAIDRRRIEQTVRLKPEKAHRVALPRADIQCVARETDRADAEVSGIVLRNGADTLYRLAAAEADHKDLTAQFGIHVEQIRMPRMARHVARSGAVRQLHDANLLQLAAAAAQAVDRDFIQPQVTAADGFISREQ